MSRVGRIRGVVLAGGLGRRLGGDKTRAMLCGRSLLARALRRLEPQCEAIAISRHGAGDAVEPNTLVLADAVAGRVGPLAGVLAALEWCAADDPAVSHVATVAVDTPFFPDDLVARLAAALERSDAAIGCAASGGRVHPVAALWPVAARTDLRKRLVGGGGRRVATVLDGFGFVVAEWPVAPFDPFFNVNTPADLAEAERLAVMVDPAVPSGQ